MEQLPLERITPDAIFGRVGIDYAGPVYIKQGSVRNPVVVEAYICVLSSKGRTHRSGVRFDCRIVPSLLEEVCRPERETSLDLE